MENPTSPNVDHGLETLIAPSSLTLGGVARLERIKSPLLQGDFNSTFENVKALLVIGMDANEFLSSLDKLDVLALKHCDGMAFEDYNKGMNDLAKGLVDFGFLMPRVDESAKKNNEVTDG